MSVEGWKYIFDIATVVLLLLTFGAGAGSFITTSILNKRQEAQLRRFDSDLTSAKIDLGKQQVRAAEADSKVVGLEKDAADAKAEMAKQQNRAAIAERSLLELKEHIKPRRLTDKQSADFVRELKNFSHGEVNFGTTAGGGDEAFNLAKQLLPLFRAAGWKVPGNTSGMSNHLDIQVIGVAILTRGPEGLGSNKYPPGYVLLTPALQTLVSAFRIVGIEPSFINYHPGPGDTPEVVIGSKPEATATPN